MRLQTDQIHALPAYAIIALLFNVAMDVLAKLIASDTETWQIVVLRWAFGAAILALPFAMTRNQGPKTPWHGVHFMRTVLNFIASFCLFHALGALPLSVVLSIFFLEPMMAMLAAAVILRERTRARQWICGILGLSGALIMVGSAGAELDNSQFLNTDALIALCGAISWAVMRVLTKRYGANISPVSLSFWMASLTSLLATPAVLLFWSPLPMVTMGIILGMALCGAVYNYMWLSALMVVPVARLSNLSYLVPPLSFFFGLVIFDELPQVGTVLGSGFILLSTMASLRPLRVLNGPQASRRQFGGSK